MRAAVERLALLLAWLAWTCLLAAVARPQFTGEPVSLPSSGRDLMLAIDISGSMNTEDMEVAGRVTNRLNAVKDVVTDFIARRAGDRVGLILFGTNAYLQAPLTFDLATVEKLLDDAPVGIAGGKTAIGDAIGLAVKRLRTRPADSRVLILMTDGASNAGEVPPDKAAQLAHAEGVKIYTVGVGAEELRVPGFWGEIGGRVVNPSADMDTKALRTNRRRNRWTLLPRKGHRRTVEDLSSARRGRTHRTRSAQLPSGAVAVPLPARGKLAAVADRSGTWYTQRRVCLRLIRQRFTFCGPGGCSR